MSKERPIFSIITPTFNGERFIDRTIKSVIDQTFKDFEFIIINDGSKDNTHKKLKDWTLKDSRIKTFDTTGFGGPVEPMNIGIKNSMGTYISFLDHDDTWEKNKLELLLKNFKEQASDLIISSVYLSDDKTQEISRLERNNIENLLSGKYFNTFSSITAKRELFESIGLLDNRISILPDYELVIRTISNDKDVLFLDIPLATHHFHESNLSLPEKSLVKRSVDLLYILSKHKNYLKKQKKVRSHILNTVARIFLKTGQNRKAFMYYLRSFIIYPLNINSLIKASLCLLGENNYEKLKTC